MLIVLTVVLLGVWIVFERSQSAVNLDLTVFEADERVVPFYELLFDYVAAADAWSVADPILRRRGRPLMPADEDLHLGPHDLIGFRNEAIPRSVDIVTIGDSQTYGNNADLEESWPSRLAELADLEIYNMSLGGWGGLSYLYMLPKAIELRPRLVIVALYMGNDSIENTLMAYNQSYWADYRPDPDTTIDDIAMNIRTGERESLRLDGGVSMPFQTLYRFDVNRLDSLGVDLGYAIQERTVREMAALAAERGVELVFTIVPTKEKVYEAAIRASGQAVSPELEALWDAEARRLDSLLSVVEDSGAAYVEIQSALAARVEAGQLLYPTNGDGHPNADGYHAIAVAIHERTQTLRASLFD